MTAKRIRDGVGGKAYRRQSKALKRKTEMQGLVCAWCGGAIDTTLDHRDPMSFTMDHPQAIANGGSLTGQEGKPMHRRCNAAKSDQAPIDLGQWGAS